jgi:glutamate 5-kinase
MITKILAAKRAAGSGASTVIAWGREPGVLMRLSQGEAIGTLLTARTQKQQARKQWMADHLQLAGFGERRRRAASRKLRTKARACCRSA